MEKEEIKQLAAKYLQEIIKPRNEHWMQYITDSWMHTAENWFCNEYEIITGFACPQDKIDIFKLYLYTEANKAFDKKFGVRNAKYMVDSAYNDIVSLQENLKVAIDMFKNGDNPDNEYLPIPEIQDVIYYNHVSQQISLILIHIFHYI